MALLTDELLALTASGESATVEFKSGVPAEHVLAANLSAFANSQGGTLLLGVDDKGAITGLTEEEARRARHRLRKIASSLLPTPAQVGEALLNGKWVVYARVGAVPEHLRPVITATGQVYTRQGSTSRLASGAEAQLLLARGAPAPVAPQRRTRVFVAMSFRDEQEPSLVDYYAAMKRAADATGLPLDLVRIDRVDGDFEISQRIMDEIDSCEIVITDFTLSPPNVYFELGYARGCKGKQIIQTARKGTTLEFDVRNWRTEFYRNATELEERLVPALRAAYAQVTGQAPA